MESTTVPVPNPIKLADVQTIEDAARYDRNMLFGLKVATALVAQEWVTKEMTIDIATAVYNQAILSDSHFRNVLPDYPGNQVPVEKAGTLEDTIADFIKLWEQFH